MHQEVLLNAIIFRREKIVIPQTNSQSLELVNMTAKTRDGDSEVFALLVLAGVEMINVISQTIRARLWNPTVGVALIAVFLIGFYVGYRKVTRRAGFWGMPVVSTKIVTLR
jgi:hypothetical protein